ncbi:MAG: nucleotidyltransferase domain-containing protein [Parcubacteria group bacterium]|nr:nucleotidyltransferase domain-containing protein [Parcubacteria group bacterium]
MSIYSNNKELNRRVAKVFSILKKLKDDERYRACLIFGSSVRGEFVKGSDIDVKVVVGGKDHSELNHIRIDGIKLDISFNSIERLREDTEKELERAKRIPIVSESIVLFDKDGKLKDLIADAKKRRLPKKYSKSKHDWVRFVILNEDLKVKRHLHTDPVAANHVMHTGLRDILDMYYEIVGRWHTSNKKTLSDLKKWDPKLRDILTKILSAKNMDDKFTHWTKMIDHILNKLGGRIDIEKTGCDCKICQQDISHLRNLVEGQ